MRKRNIANMSNPSGQPFNPMTTPNDRVADAAIDPVYLNRWSPRSFNDSPITETELKAILEAARWAPSAMNAQPWRFAYTLRGDSAWAAINGGLVPGNQLWAGKAAALVVIASYTKLTLPTGGDPVPNASHALDAGAAWAFLALNATQQGWFTHAMGGFDAAAIAAAVNLPADTVVHAVVAIGKQGPADVLPDALQAREKPSPRHPLSALAFHGKF